MKTTFLLPTIVPTASTITTITILDNDENDDNGKTSTTATMKRRTTTTNGDPVFLSYLMDWDQPQLLWEAICQEDGISASRLRRQAQGLGRAITLTGRQFKSNARVWKEAEVDHETTPSRHDTAPVSLHESAILLL